VPEQDLFGDVPTPAPRVVPSRKPVSQPAHTWFFALRPSQEDALRLQTYAERFLLSHGVSGKRIGAERLHITLDLVGHDVEPAIENVATRVGERVQCKAFDVLFDAAMTFSAPSAPLVLLGGQGLDAVRALRTELACALADTGFAPPHSFEPHMTLCYDPRHRLARTPIAPLGFRATEFVLVKSHIGFSRHEVLRTWALLA
jgi:2'-5' RNA ligase